MKIYKAFVGACDFFRMVFAKQLSKEEIKVKIIEWLEFNPGTKTYDLYKLFPAINNYKKGKALTIGRFHMILADMETDGFIYHEVVNLEGHSLYIWFIKK